MGSKDILGPDGKPLKKPNRAIFGSLDRFWKHFTAVAAIVAIITTLFINIDQLKKLMNPGAVTASVDALKSGDQILTNRKSYTQEITDLSYEQIPLESGISVFPVMEYLDHIRTSKEIMGMNFHDTPFYGSFPVLSVKMVNNTSDTLFINKLNFYVKSRAIDYSPIIFVKQAFGNLEQLKFSNQGWGPVNNPIVQIDRWGIPNDPHAVDPCSNATIEYSRNYIQNIKSFDSDAAIELWHKIPFSFGEFINHVCVYGSLKYDDDNHEYGNEIRFRSKLTKDGNVSILFDTIPSRIRYDLFLDSEGDEENKTVLVEERLKPGEVGHIQVRISSNKTTSFDMSVTASDVSGKTIDIGDVKLKIIVPRSSELGGEISFSQYEKLPLSTVESYDWSDYVSDISLGPHRSNLEIRLLTNQPKHGCSLFEKDISEILKDLTNRKDVLLTVSRSDNTQFCETYIRNKDG